jgi:DHA1 family multidrug resistance protein-like MFS transporter
MVALQGIMSMSVTVSWPFLPLYVNELGIHPLTAASMWAGIISSPQFLLAAIVAPLWGALADRVGRKAMVLRCSLSMAFFTLLMGLVTDVWQLFVLSILYGIFSGYSAAATAMVGTSVPEDRLGYALGWMATAQLAGTLIGPLVGGALADLLHSYRYVFFCSSAGGVLAVTGAAFLVREIRPSTEARNARRPESSGGMFRELFAQRELIPMFVVLLLAQMCATALGPVVAPYVRSLLPGSPFVGTLSGAAIAVTGLAGLLSSPILGRRSDRIGRRKVVLLSILGAALFTLPQAFSHSIWLFIILRSGVGLFLGGIVPTANAWLGGLYPREQRGRIFGLAASAGSLGVFFGPLTGGIVANHFGMPAVFIVVGTLMLLNFAWVLLATGRPPATT